MKNIEVVYCFQDLMIPLWLDIMTDKLIIFDIDDTLYNEIDYVKSGFKIISDYIENKYNINNIYERLIKLFNESRINVFNRLLDELNINYNDEDIKYLVNIYRNHKPNIRLSNNTISVLKVLRKKYNLAIISDGNYDTQRLKSEVLELDKYFDEIILTDKYGKDYWKPDRKSFDLLSEKFNINLNNMYYIGDNPNKDFYISKYGIKTIRYYNELGLYYKDNYKDNIKELYRINNLEEIKSIID